MKTLPGWGRARLGHNGLAGGVSNGEDLLCGWHGVAGKNSSVLGWDYSYTASFKAFYVYKGGIVGWMGGL